MDSFKLAYSNLKYILQKGNILTLRFALAVGSILWAIWAFFILEIDAHTPTVTTLLPPIIPLWAWGCLFLIHGLWALEQVLLKLPCLGIKILCSMMGVILWTSSSIIVMIIQLSIGHLPILGGAHLLASMIAWWIFFDALQRNGKMNDEFK